MFFPKRFAEIQLRTKWNCKAICILLSNFKFQTIIWPWNSLKPWNRDDNFFALVFKTVFKYKIQMLGNPTYNMNIACLRIFNEFSEIFKNIYREEIDNLSVKSFTGRYSGLISYLDFEFWISRQKSYHRRFSVFSGISC